MGVLSCCKIFPWSCKIIKAIVDHYIKRDAIIINIIKNEKMRNN